MLCRWCHTWCISQENCIRLRCGDCANRAGSTALGRLNVAAPRMGGLPRKRRYRKGREWSWDKVLGRIKESPGELDLLLPQPQWCVGWSQLCCCQGQSVSLTPTWSSSRSAIPEVLHRQSRQRTVVSLFPRVSCEMPRRFQNHSAKIYIKERHKPCGEQSTDYRSPVWIQAK